MTLPPVVFITVGRLTNISGGYIFGLAVVNGLRALGHAVDVWELEPSHPLLVKGTAATAFEKGVDGVPGAGGETRTPPPPSTPPPPQQAEPQEEEEQQEEEEGEAPLMRESDAMAQYSTLSAGTVVVRP